MASLSCHAASGNLALGLGVGGQVEMCQLTPYNGPQAGPYAAPQAGAYAAPQAGAYAAPQAGAYAAPQAGYAAPQAGENSAPQAEPEAAPQVPLPNHACARERLAEAQAQADTIDESLSKAESGLRQKMSREQELKRSIADLESKRTHICSYICSYYSYTNKFLVASEKAALNELCSAEYLAETREFSEMTTRREALAGIIDSCTKTIDSLTESLSASGLEDLRGDAFNEWLCDIGLGKLQAPLKDIDGVSLTMLNVDNVMENDVSFADAAALQLRAYIAHYKLSDDSAFGPPTDSVLSWDATQTANWIESLGDPYSSLAAAGWHGAALCSLSPPRVVEAAKGALKIPDAVKFIGMVRTKRTETDSDKATWVAKWTGTGTIENQA